MWNEENNPEDQSPSAVEKPLPDAGATAVEYGLMVSLIAIVIVAAVALIGVDLTNIFNTMAAGL